MSVTSVVKLFSGPAGYAVPLLVGGVLIYIVYHALKAPAKAIADTATAAYNNAQNFDTNVGLGGFDAWVSSLFDKPATSYQPPDLTGIPDYGVIGSW